MRVTREEGSNQQKPGGEEITGHRWRSVHNELRGTVQGPALQAGSIAGDVTITDQSASLTQHALSFGPGASVQQAAGNIYNTYWDTSTASPSLVSVSAPLGRLEYATRGRNTLVRTISDVILNESGQVAVLHAAGGYGKTTVALRVVQTVADRRDIWWVDASTEITLTDGLREVALQAGGDREMIRQAWSSRMGAAPDLLWRILNARTEPWLLVLDGADDPGLLAPAEGRHRDGRGWLRSPESGQGSVLITSRTRERRVWGDAVLHPVDALPDEAAAQILLDQAPDAGPRTDAIELAQRLGGLPLALRLAGSYLASTRSTPPLPGLIIATTFADYREAWDRRFVEVTDLSWSTEQHGDRELLTRTWELSLDLLAERGFALSRPLLRALSWLGPAPVPYVMLDAEPFANSPLFVDELTPSRLRTLLTALAEVGLAETARDSRATGQEVPSVEIHPVIRDASRHHVGRDPQQDEYTDLAVSLLFHMISGLNPTQHDWPLWRSLIPHANIARNVVADENARRENRSRSATICHEAGFFCEQVGLDHLCLEFNQSAATCRTELLGREAALTLGSRHNLAKTLWRFGRIDEAESEYQNVLTAEKESRGANHIETLVTRFHLAGILHERGRMEAAESEYRQILAEIEKIPNASAMTLSVRNSLATALFDRGDLAGGCRLMQETVAQARKVFGANDAHTLKLAHNLASALRKRGQLHDADNSCHEILATGESHLGANHPLIIEAHSTLGQIRRDFGDLDSAEECLQQALTSARTSWGDQHPRTAEIRFEHASILEDRGDLQNAKGAYETILDMEKTVYGEIHPKTLKTRTALARVRANQGEYREARDEYREVLGLQRSLSPEAPEILSIRHNLAGALQSNRELAEAESEYRHVLELSQAIRGNEHPDTLATLHNLGCLLQDRGKLDEAEATLRKVLKTRIELFGRDHPSTLTTRINLAATVQARGDLQQSLREYQEALPDAQRIHGADHPTTLSLRNNLAVALNEAGRLPESDNLLRELVPMARTVLGSEHPNTLQSHATYATVLQKQGKLADAKTEYRRLLKILKRNEHLDPSMITSAWFNFAQVLRDTGNLGDAEKEFRKLLTYEQQVLGADNESTLITQDSLASTLFNQGKAAESKQLLNDLLAKAELSLGPQHPLVQQAQFVIGHILQ